MIFLSGEAQDAFQTAQHALFGVACVLNAVSLVCMIKVTPPHQAKIRNYVLMIQITTIINSIYMDVLLQGIPLFPEMGGICLGLLCKAGIPPHVVFAGLVITYVWLAAATYFCCFFRHQTLLPESKRLNKAKILKMKSRLLMATVVLVPSTATSTYAAFPFDPVIPHDLAWAADRGPLFIHERSPVVMFFIAAVVLVLGGCVLIFLTLFLRMYHTLYHNKQRSAGTIRKIRKSLIILFIQIFIPFLMLIGPAILMLGGMVIECIPFEINLFLFGVMTFHPIMHNLILFGVSPTYRGFLISLMRKRKKLSIAHERQTTVVFTTFREIPRQRGISIN